MSHFKKKVVLISPFFYPEPISTGKFNTDFVNSLKDKVQSITVICSHPFYPEWKVKYSNKQLEGVHIIRGGKHIYYFKNSTLRRVVLELWYTLFVVYTFCRIRQKTDIVIPIFPPSLAFYTINFFVKKETKVIGLIHDLQEVYASKKKGIINKVIRFFINNIEGSALRGCDKLIFLSYEMRETAEKYYKLNKGKLTVQYPFVTLNYANNTSDLNNLLPSNKRNIVYSGALGEKQSPKELYSFFNYASKKIDNTLFHFFSSGHIFDQLKKMNKNEKILFHDLVPKKNIEELYKKSTIQIIPQKAGTSKGSLPSKLPNILASGCSALVITDKNSELDMFFKKYDINTVVTSWENEVLCTVLNNLLEKNQGSNITIMNTAKKLFNIDSMVDEILS